MKYVAYICRSNGGYIWELVLYFLHELSQPEPGHRSGQLTAEKAHALSLDYNAHYFAFRDLRAQFTGLESGGDRDAYMRFSALQKIRGDLQKKLDQRKGTTGSRS